MTDDAHLRMSPEDEKILLSRLPAYSIDVPPMNGPDLFTELPFP